MQWVSTEEEDGVNLLRVLSVSGNYKQNKTHCIECMQVILCEARGAKVAVNRRADSADFCHYKSPLHVPDSLTAEGFFLKSL